MKLITIAGPPSSGKTSVILRLAEVIKKEGEKIGVVKFDCLTSFDQKRYHQAKIPVSVGCAGKFCPDHFFVSNLEGAFRWGAELGLDVLITESAGLCNRCSPYVRGVTAVCVIDHLAGVETPRKIGPMLRLADLVVMTKGDIVSQAEREVFAFYVRQANTKAKLIPLNGITGQGALLLKRQLSGASEPASVKELKLRFTTPAAVCSYCTGETRMGEAYQMGMMKRMEFVAYGDE